MKKLFFILFSNFILVNSAYCICYGCLQLPTVESLIKEGNTLYDTNDNEIMFKSFEVLVSKMRDNYSNLENVTWELFEKNAKIQYEEVLNSSNVTFEATRMNELNSTEIDAKSLKTKKNVDVKLK